MTIKAPTFSSANIARFPIYSGFIIVNQAASGLVKAQRYSGESLDWRGE